MSVTLHRANGVLSSVSVTLELVYLQLRIPERNLANLFGYGTVFCALSLSFRKQMLMDATAAAVVVINQEHCLHHTIDDCVYAYIIFFGILDPMVDCHRRFSTFFSLWKIVIPLKYCRHHDEFH